MSNPMNPIRQIIEDAPDFIPVPASLRHRRIELILWPLDEPTTENETHDASGWPVGFLEQTFGSIPDFPEREPQGEYEQRLELE